MRSNDVIYLTMLTIAVVPVASVIISIVRVSVMRCQAITLSTLIGGMSCVRPQDECNSRLRLCLPLSLLIIRASHQWQ
jgi:hypothetical protein